MKIIRNPRRRYTDGMIGVKFREPPYRKDLDERLNRKDELFTKYATNNINDIPVYDRDLHTSLIFDVIDKDEGNDNKRNFFIDPMDKRYVFYFELTLLIYKPSLEFYLIKQRFL